jgi:hypothetical protein
MMVTSGHEERASRLNILAAFSPFAFHRALLTMGVLTSAMLAIVLVLSELGVDSATSALRPSLVYLLVLSLALTAIEFVRARQRGEYFAIEVLDMAYIQSLEGSATPTTG